jgi:nitrate reductase NapAB chaperone NapD
MIGNKGGTPVTIQSYLLYPERGKIGQVRDALAGIPGCEAIPAQNRDLLVLVTEAPDADAQSALENCLEALPGVECLALVSGWTEPI